MSGDGVPPERRPRTLVVIRGSGEVGSALADLLFRNGYPVLLHDVARPVAMRRGMAFTDAIFDGVCRLEGVPARRIDELDHLAAAATIGGAIPVTALEFTAALAVTQPEVLVDARMRKRAIPEPQMHLAPLTLGLGPNFTAGETTHLAVETCWGDHLGAILEQGTTLPLAGDPRPILGHSRDRFVYARCDGVFRTEARITDPVRAGQVVGWIDDEPVRAPLDGTLRGLTHDDVPVMAGTKMVEVDPSGDPSKAFGIRQRPRRIAESILGRLDSQVAAARL